MFKRDLEGQFESIPSLDASENNGMLEDDKQKENSVMLEMLEEAKQKENNVMLEDTKQNENSVMLEMLEEAKQKENNVMLEDTKQDENSEMLEDAKQNGIQELNSGTDKQVSSSQGEIPLADLVSPSPSTNEDWRVNRGSKRVPLTETVHLPEQLSTYRLVDKHGYFNIASSNIEQKGVHFLQDIFTTVIEASWVYVLLLFFAFFILTWLSFALIWWVCAVLHNDHTKPDNSTALPCVDGVFDFHTAFLFSLETMHTIGYGTRAITTECKAATIILIFQSCFGVIVQCLMTGLVFAKIARPTSRVKTIMFSRYAVVNKLSGDLCLRFRIADMRRSHLISATIRAVMVWKRVDEHGEGIPISRHNFPLETELGDNSLILAWPTVVTHRINPDSPLYDLTPELLNHAEFEIIVILEGTLESTGMPTQIRTSYLPSEVLWGHRMARMLTSEQKGIYKIDYSMFDVTKPVDAAYELSKKKKYKQLRRIRFSKGYVPC